MPIGPGKYDELCLATRLATSARGVLVIVIDGARGTGFSVQADLVTTAKLPEILERAAAEIRASLREGKI